MVQDDTEEKKVVAAVLAVEKDNVGWAEEIADKTDGNNVHGITYQESVSKWCNRRLQILQPEIKFVEMWLKIGLKRALKLASSALPYNRDWQKLRRVV
jgi:hypothetical protein